MIISSNIKNKNKEGIAIQLPNKINRRKDRNDLFDKLKKSAGSGKV